MSITISIGRFEVSPRMPQVSRARMVTTTSLASSFTSLWIAAPIYLTRIPLVPDTTVSPEHVLAGVAIPFGVGYVTLMLAEWRARRDLQAVDQRDGVQPHASATAGEVQVHAAEADRAATQSLHRSPVRVIDGEVVSR